MVAEHEVDLREAARTGLLQSYRDQGATAWLTTHGTSMRPLIDPGCRVLIEFGARPVVGEIALFATRGGLVAHRVVGRRRSGTPRQLIVKGDSEAYPDRPLDPAEVLGVIRAVRRPGDRRARTAGFGGPRGRIIARASLWSGRGARVARRIVIRLPDGARTLALRAIPTFARVPTRLVTAPLTPRHGAERR